MKSNTTLAIIVLVTSLLSCGLVLAEPHVFWENPLSKATNTTVVALNYNGYDYGVNQTSYQAYYKSQLSYGDAIMYCRQGYCFTIQPTKLTYRNNLGSNDDLFSSPSTNLGRPISNIFFWNDIFGSSDISYGYDFDRLKEKLILEEEPRIPVGTLGNSSLVSLDLDTYIKYPIGVDLYINNTKVINDITTNLAIEFRNASGQVIYYLPEPFAEDADGNQVKLTYQVVFDGKYNANKERTIFFYTKTPYHFINNSAYPINIDPTITFSTASITSVATAPLGPDSFIIAYCDDTADDISFIVYNTSGVNITGEVDADTSAGSCDYSCVSVAAFNSTSFVVAWADQGDTDYTFEIYNLGTNLTGDIDVATAGGGGKAVSVSALNSTDFVIGWFVTLDYDIKYAIYNTGGTLKTGPVTTDADVTNSYSVSVTALNATNFIVGYFDDTDGDNTYVSYNLVGNITKQIDVDTSGGYPSSLSALNSTNFVYSYFDYGLNADDDASFAIYNYLNVTSGVVDADTDVGASYSVATTALNSTSHVIAWYDATDSDITYAVYSGSTVVTSPFDVTTSTAIRYLDTASYEAATSIGICNNNFIIAYVNTTALAYWNTYNANGQTWAGACGSFTPTAPTSVTATGYLVNSLINASASGGTVNYGNPTYFYQFYNYNHSVIRQNYSTVNTYLITEANDLIGVRVISNDGISSSTSYTETNITTGSLTLILVTTGSGNVAYHSAFDETTFTQDAAAVAVFTADELAQTNLSDNIRATFGGDSDASNDGYQGANWTIPGPVNFASVTMEAQSDDGSISLSMGIWNWTASKWNRMATATTTANTDLTLMYNITNAELGNFVSGNKVRAVVYTNSTADNELLVDYMAILVDYNATIGNNADSAINSSKPLVGQSIKHSTTFTTSIGGEVANYIFSWNASGPGCDTWDNTTGTTSGTNAVTISVDKTIPSACIGKNIGWWMWANNTDGITNITNIQSYVGYGYGILNVSITSPVNNLNVTQNQTFDLNATISCIGINSYYTCGNVYAYARYNGSSTSPDYYMNITTPLWVSSNPIIPTTLAAFNTLNVSWSKNYVDSSILTTFDSGGWDSWSQGGVMTVMNNTLSNCGSTTNSVQISDNVNTGAISRVFDFSKMSGTITISWNAWYAINPAFMSRNCFDFLVDNVSKLQTGVPGTLGENCRDGSITEDGWIQQSVSLTCGVDITCDSSVELRFNSSGADQNDMMLIDCISIPGSSYGALGVNATGTNNTQYMIDIFVNSSYGSGNVANNDSADRKVCIGVCQGGGGVPAAYNTTNITTSDMLSAFDRISRTNVSLNKRNSDVSTINGGLLPLLFAGRKLGEMFSPKEGLKPISQMLKSLANSFSANEILIKFWKDLELGQDSFRINEILMRVLHRNTISQDSVAIMDSMSKLGKFTKKSDDFITINEIEAAVKGLQRSGRDSISINELLSRLGIFNPRAADLLTINEFMFDNYLFSRLDGDLISVNELLAYFRLYSKSEQDYISVQELISVLFRRYRLNQDLLNINGIASRLFLRQVSSQDSVAIIDSMSRLGTFTRQPGDTIKFSEIELILKGITMRGQDSISTGELLSRLGIFSQKSSDTLTFGEYISGRFLFSRLNQDLINVKDLMTYISLHSRTGQDSMTIRELVSLLLTRYRTSQESLGFNEYTYRLASFLRRPSDLLSVSDVLVRLGLMNRATYDSMSLSDSSSKAFGLMRLARDTLSINDLIARLQAAQRASGNSITMVQLLSILGEYKRIDYSSFILNDQYYRLGLFTHKGSDILSINEILDELYKYQRERSDVFALNSMMLRMASFSRSLGDSFFITEAQSKISAFFRWLAELLGLIGQPSVSSVSASAGRLITARISPASPVDSDDLLGYCNGSFPNNENLTYNWAWYNSSTLFSNSSTGTASVTPCYQETANASTQCGGLDSGRYGCAGGTAWTTGSSGEGCNKLIDGNWATYAMQDNYNFDDFLFVNYTKPSNATSTSKWQVNYGNDGTGTNHNLSITSNCFSQNSLQFRVSFTAISGHQWINFSCWNGNSWDLLTGYNSSYVYANEEAIWWDMSSGSNTIYYPPVQEVNVANVSNLNTSKGDIWVLACQASNGTATSSWTNVSVSLFSSNIFSLSDLVSLLEARLKNIIVGKNPSEQLSLYEILVRLGLFGRRGATQLTIHDLGLSYESFFKRGNDLMTINELRTRLEQAQRTSSDRISVNELLDILGIYGRTPIQGLTISEILAMSRLTSMSPYDRLVFMDSAYKLGIFTRHGSDLLSISELLRLIGSWNMRPADTITINELLFRVGLLDRAVADSYSVYDSASYSRVLNLFLDVGDSLVFKDQLNLFAYHIRSDIEVLVFGDSQGRIAAIFVHISDLASFNEGLDFNRIIIRLGSEVIEVLDSTSAAFTRGIHYITRNVEDVLEIQSLQFEGRYSCIIGECHLEGGTIVIQGGGGRTIYIPTAMAIVGPSPLDFLGPDFSAYLAWVRLNLLWLLVALLCGGFLIYLIVRTRYERLKRKYKRETGELEEKLEKVKEKG